MNLIVDKPWGKETILTSKDSPYTAKILILNANQSLSLQYHDQKTETLVLFSGQAQITIDNQSQPMEPLTGYTIKASITHRVKAITDCQIFEASTPETGTTYRLEDDFGRGNETH